MTRSILTTALAFGVSLAAMVSPVFAAGAKKPAPEAAATAEHPKSATYRKGPQVRGFIQRRGGYSYGVADTINTYGDTRTTYGSVNSYRDPWSDRQSRNGPFDHGFFFDSGIAPRGGDSPYRN
jgi:hypothetical protein